VVKVGSALVTRHGEGLAHDFIAECARQIAALHADGRQVLLVSSGAIAAGMQRLGWKARPHAMHDLQAAAAVGQMGLAQAYESTFLGHGLKAAQILLTHDDLADRTRYLNARSTLQTLLDLAVVPIINENDTVVTDDPRLDPAATLIGEGRADDVRFEAMAGGAGSGLAKGGMITKVRAARRAAKSGAHTLIVSGREPDSLLAAARGDAIGTLLFAVESPLAARKQWLADHLQLAGALTLDAGAVKALGGGRSLLSVGVVRVEGDFERGAAVACRAPDGREIARGLISYSSSEARRIAGHGTQDIEGLLGYIDGAALIHRDNLVLL
jgi:glutamate 5-kinase